MVQIFKIKFLFVRFSVSFAGSEKLQNFVSRGVRNLAARLETPRNPTEKLLLLEQQPAKGYLCSNSCT